MEKLQVTRHPMEWVIAAFKPRVLALPEGRFIEPVVLAPRRIGLSDLRQSLKAGFQDFTACRTDVVFLCLMYPLVGLLLWRLTFGTGLIRLAFPLISGFALVGPVFAAGLYEMSRQREQGRAVGWATAFAAFRSPAIGSIVALGTVLLGLFAAWITTAELIYHLTVGATIPHWMPVTSAVLLQHLLTGPGVAMILLGVGAGAVFAVIVLATSVISFPLLLDRHVGVAVAVGQSLRAVRENPITLLAWGAIVAAGLLLGSLPFLLGLAFTLPVLGHATWHLYRRLYP